jgi:hypothetical protein
MKALLLAAALLLCSGCVTVPSPGSVQKGQDPYSVNCSSGTFAVFNGSGAACEVPGICDYDSDCSYLDVNGTPRRVGHCFLGTCKAACGTGALHECVN